MEDIPIFAKASRRSVTLDDVALSVGVSAKTVSRVVNKDPNVSGRTRLNVEQAIASLNYRPNMAARSLASSRSFLIGVLTVHIPTGYSAALHSGAARGCRLLGSHLALEELRQGDPAMLRQFEANLRHVRMDGMLLAPPFADDETVLDMLDRLGIPYVRISPAQDPERSHAVFADELAGVEAMAEHLWQLGHRKYGLVKGLPDQFATAIRGEGFIKAIVARGGRPSDIRSVAMGSGMILQDGFAAARSLLTEDGRPTAVFAFNDRIAAGVLAYAQANGIAVPNDLAVAGFDDSEAASLVWPGITTIHQPISEMAQAAVQLLVESPSPRQRIVCPVKLIVRGSTQASAENA